MRGKTVDKTFLGIVAVLLLGGMLIFSSASLGLLTRVGGPAFSLVELKQLLMGVGLGSLLAFAVSKIPYTFWRKAAFWIFFASLVMTALVFVPHLGLEHGGGKRWLSLGPFSFQPAEFLKIGFVMYAAAWMSAVKGRIRTLKYGLLPLLAMLAIAGGLLLKQPDTATFMNVFFAGIAIYVAGGGRFRDLLLLLLVSACFLAALISVRPYLMDRVKTFLDPARDPLGAGYQIQQSLIAIGSGEVLGRGFGQSIQKFNYLPEPTGDSIFAVAAEEFGFVGSAALILLYLAFTLRGFRIAARAPDAFGGLLTVGIVILIVSESFINISSMLGLIPLSGLPLLFVSQGGTAMLFTLVEVGIVLNVSRSAK